jgi:hypothetical protein
MPFLRRLLSACVFVVQQSTRKQGSQKSMEFQKVLFQVIITEKAFSLVCVEINDDNAQIYNLLRTIKSPLP